MTRTKVTVTLTALILSLLPLSSSVGSSSTISIVSSNSTVCAILSGGDGDNNSNNSPQSILCASPRNPSSPFPAFPNASFLSLSGGGSSFCAFRPDSLTFLCFNSPTFSPKRVHTGPVPLLDLSLGSTHVASLAQNPSSIRFWRAGPAFPVSVLGSFSSLTSGKDFTCAIRRGGVTNNRVECWGYGSDRIESTFANETMSTLVAGDSHTCGVNTAGSLICTGRVPRSAKAIRFAALALGDERTCCGIKRANGTVVCWGVDGVEYSPIGNTSVEVLVAGADLTCGVTTVKLSVVCWVADPNNLMVTVLPLPKILPGICVKEEEQERVCACGIIPDSKSFCSGLGVICKNVCPIESAPTPLPASSSRKKTSRWWWVFAIIGGVGSLMCVSSVIYCTWNWFCRQNKVHNSVQPTIAAAANGNGGSNANVGNGNGNSGVVPGARVSPSSSKSRIFRRQSSRAVMNRQWSGPSSFKDRAEQFSLSDLAAATKNFSMENKIGAGSFGTVYKGRLSDGRKVAIKRSETSLKMMTLQEKESAFRSELSFLSRVHHKHLVRLVGYCDEGEERLLVYEYMKNGALYDHLHSRSDRTPTALSSWKTRIKVLLDASRGIEYLHDYAVPPIIHRDIKSSNVLLDSNWVARVSDFGLSLLEPTTGNSDGLSTRAAGTVGYMDPKYYGSHHLTVKSDVYSLGVVMLEVLTGKGRPASVVDYATPHVMRGEALRILERTVGQPGAREVEAAELVAYTAVRCVSLEAKETPSMADVVSNLETALALCLCEESGGSTSPGYHD